MSDTEIGGIKWVLDLTAKAFHSGMDTAEKKIKGFTDKLTHSSKEADAFANKMNQHGDTMMKFGAKMSLGVTLPVLAAGKAMFEGASDTAESMSKIKVVFGEQSQEVIKWSEKAAESMGLSSQKALEYAGTFGNLFQAFGVGKKAAQEMSTDLVKVAADLASFNNTDIETALLALKSGISGESEPLKQFGIALTEDRIKAEALSAGLVKGAVNSAKVEKANIAVAKSQLEASKATKRYGKDSKEAREANNKLELSQQALAKEMEGGAVTLDAATKSQAIYNLIKKDGVLAEDDFLETSGGAAGQLKIMKARMEDAAAEMGTALIPVVQKLAGWVSKLAEWFSGLSKGQQKFILIAAGVAAAIGPVVTVLGAFAKAIGGVVKAQQWLVSDNNKMTNAIKSAGSKVVEYGKKFKDAATSGIETFRLKSMYAKDAIKAKGSQLKDTAGKIKDYVKGLKDSTAATKANTAATKASEKAKSSYKAAEKLATDTVKKAVTWIKAQTLAVKQSTVATKLHAIASKAAAIATRAFAIAMAFLTSPIGLIIVAITAIIAILVVLYKKNEAFRNFVDKAWKAIANFFVNAWNNYIFPVLKAIGEWFKNTGIKWVKAYWAAVQLYWKAIIAVIKWAWNNIIKPIWTAIVWYVQNILIPGVKQWWEVIKTVWNAVAAVVTWAWNNVIKPLWDVIVWYITNVLIPYWKMIWNVVVFVWNAIVAVVKWAWENVIKPVWDLIWAYITNVLIPVWQKIWDIAVAVWNGIWNVITSVWAFIQPIWDAIWNFITTKLVPAFQAIWDKVSSVFTSVWNKIKEVIDWVKGKFDEVKDKITGFINKVKEIKDKVTGVFDDVKDWLYDVGKDLIQGLINGVKDMAGKLKDGVKGVVKGGVNAAKNLLGIGSPSRVFKEIGQWTMEGYAIGLKDQQPVMQALNKLSNLTANTGREISQDLVAKATTPSSTSSNAPAKVEFHATFDNSGIFARSDAELREITLRQLELANDWAKTQKLDPLFDGKVKGNVA